MVFGFVSIVIVNIGENPYRSPTSSLVICNPCLRDKGKDAAAGHANIDKETPDLFSETFRTILVNDRNFAYLILPLRIVIFNSLLNDFVLVQLPLQLSFPLVCRFI